MIANRIKPIKTDEDYQEALALLEELIDASPEVDTLEAEQLDILSSLIKSYEDEHYYIDAPSAVESIKFVMEQRDLEAKDLEVFIGSKGRVSEVLSGKRGLSIDMIRSLETGLGIPAKALIKKADNFDDTGYESWNERVFGEMSKRGYFQGIDSSATDKASLLKLFFESINRPATVGALLKQSSYRTSTGDRSALAAWAGFVIKEADRIDAPSQLSEIDEGFMLQLAKLSASPDGPLRAQAALLEKGIKLIIEPAFPKTYIDGATIFTEETPIIGLTLRHDRLDNFWFTLMHEVAHVILHSDDDKIDIFYDELYETKDINPDDKEMRADALAAESLVPFKTWENSAAHLVPSEITFNLLAKDLNVHPSIIAGKYRHDNKDWKAFSDIVKDSKVRHIFESKA